MYYLNDQHPKTEYAIYKRVNNAVPYIISNTFSSKQEVREFLEATIRHHQHYHHTYYIDTVGYREEQYKDFAQFYYKVLQRPVNDWEIVS